MLNGNIRHANLHVNQKLANRTIRLLPLLLKILILYANNQRVESTFSSFTIETTCVCGDMSRRPAREQDKFAMNNKFSLRSKYMLCFRSRCLSLTSGQNYVGAVKIFRSYKEIFNFQTQVS